MLWSAIGAAGLGLAVILGAFGAHGLRGKLDAYSMGIYERAVFYHFIHAIGLLVVPILARMDALRPSAGTLVCALLAAGIALFSGSLYLLALTGTRWLGVTAARTLDGPPPELAYKRKVRLGEALRDVWRSRGLIRTLTERDLRVRYKQAVLGFVWAILTPFVLMVVFTVFFQRVANVDTHGAPYPLFAYLGLIPWGFFSSCVSGGGTSILSNISLLNKVYCPREVFPIAAVGVAAADTAVSLFMLALLFGIYTVARLLLSPGCGCHRCCSCCSPSPSV